MYAVYRRKIGDKVAVTILSTCEKTGKYMIHNNEVAARFKYTNH